MIDFEMNLAERIVFISDLCLHPWALMQWCIKLDNEKTDSETALRRSKIACAAIELHNDLYNSKQLVFNVDGVSIDLPYMRMFFTRRMGPSATSQNIASILWDICLQDRKLSGGITISIMKRNPIGFDRVTEFMDIHAAVSAPSGYFVSMVG